jgi:cytochrome c-type biogenesis protein CcmH
MTKGLSFGITLALLILIVVCVHPTLAVNPDEVLADPVLESRAREISKGLRCLVCQNQSIDDSDADLAKDLRILVRERLSAGDSNEDVTHFVVSLYGDFVLLKPPFKMSTIALWLGPLVIMLIGLVAVGVFFRRRRIAATQGQQTKPLSKDEIRRLNKFLKSDNT